METFHRRKCKEIRIGNRVIGGDAPIAVQTMLFCRPEDLLGNVQQAVEAEKMGCDILRVAIPNEEAVALIPAIKSAVSIPLVADIHFDYRLALFSVEAGADKIRINPGNIGSEDRIEKVAKACLLKNIPIRVGVNSGSVEKDLLAKYGGPTAEALAESGLRNIECLERFDFTNLVLSLKASTVKTMVDAYRLVADQMAYPLHLGVTEAGTERMGIIKSSAGIGSLLMDGIGDTIRVTLTEECSKEIQAGHDLLRALDLEEGVQIISCPTCGRTSIDLISLTKEVEERLKNVKKPIKIAVMGCVVNGPGEAKEADIGIAAGSGNALLFKKGEIIGKYPESEILDVLMGEIEKL